MTYEIEYVVKPEHIDFQGIMDGLYYTFYLEDCRHSYLKDVLKIDIESEAKGGTNIVLSQYAIKFMRPLREDDVFQVTCSTHPDKDGKATFHVKQEILRDKKLITSAVFTATFVRSGGGRPFLPEKLVDLIKDCSPVSKIEF